MKVDPFTLERAVRAICPDIKSRLDHLPPRQFSETELWEELACCVLSSQVPYELAQNAAKKISEENLLNGLSDYSSRLTYESKLLAVLKSPLNIGVRLRRYRFPNAKARQITETRYAIKDLGVDLSDIVFGSQTAFDVRSKLVQIVRGMGPKQASMFIRNVGRSYDLAILDRHILNYMNLIGLAENIHPGQLSHCKYQAIEESLHDYARTLGYYVGHLDWAIWIVMRVARREGYI